MRFKFQCPTGGNAAIAGPGIGYRIGFGYVFASGEYRYYGNRGHGIDASSEVVHGNDAVGVLLNERNVKLLCIDEDDVDDGGGGMADIRRSTMSLTSMLIH